MLAITTLPALGLLAILFIAYRFVQKYRDLSTARKLGAKPAPYYPQPAWDPLALTSFKDIIQADKAKHLPDLLNSRYLEMCDATGRDTPTYKFNILGGENYFTCDPRNIQALLATQFHDFSLGTIRKANFFPLLGSGIFTSDGKRWEHSRAMLRPSFARDRVADLDMEERHNQNMMRALPALGDGWTAEIDLQPVFFRLTLDSATEFLFGESVNSQLSALPDYKSESPRDEALNEKVFAFAFDRAQWHLSRRARFAQNYWMHNPKEFQKVCQQCHDFIDHYVRLALSKEQSDSKAEKGKYIFLEELAQQTRDPVELRSQLLHILLAGRDTTASLLGWLFMLLARNPNVFQKLRSAVVDTFGTESAPNEDISFASLKNCQYLQHSLSEALRIYPVVPGNSRQAQKDTTLPRGGGPTGEDPIFVPKGMEVSYSVHVMHRRHALWGADAEEFKPERWIGRRPGWDFLPFNGGPRICLGQQFALTSAGYAVVRLLQRFDEIQDCETDRDVKHNLTLTTCSANGVKVRLHRAEKD